MEFTAEQIASLINGHVEGNPKAVITDVSKIEEGKPGTLSFLANPKYSEYLYTTKATAVIINNNFKLKQPTKAALIRVEDAYQAFAQLLDYYQQLKPQKSGISDKAIIERSAVIGNDAYVGANAYIGHNVKIGKGVIIYPHTFIDENVQIGNNTTIYANCSVYEGSEIGENCIIHAGCVIGADGFGFAPNENGGGYKKIPQIGKVIIENDVEIGANSAVDRATMGATYIRRGVKLDNLIQVGHNAEIGENTVIAAQTGVAGSVKIGANCMIGGQVGFSGHLEIADGVKIGAQSGIMRSVKEKGAVIQGSPAMPYRDFFKSQAVFMQLPALDKKIHNLLVNSKQKEEKK
jgi:UDP-3-O-[3-hydroxymyristoyl] glucosamine N-acyltransferase